MESVRPGAPKKKVGVLVSSGDLWFIVLVGVFGLLFGVLYLNFYSLCLPQ